MAEFRPYTIDAEAWERLRRDDQEPVARDLVATAGVAPGDVVLDIGTGTGFVARAVQTIGAAVVGVDPSLSMLRAFPDRGTQKVTAAAPGLPFPPCTFDGALGNLVLSHFTDPEAALADLTMVLRPGGVLALSAWGPGSAWERSPVDDIADLWWEVAAAHLAPQDAEAVINAVIPWEDHFSDPDHLVAALDDAGLRGVRLREERYPLELSATEALNFLSTGMRWQWAHHTLGDTTWDELLSETARRAEQRFPDRFLHVRPMMIASGHKAGGEGDVP